MEYIGIIITIIIIIALAASKRKKPTKEDGDETQAQARPSTMSDIQKAFMMLSGLDEEKPAPRPAVTPTQTPRPVVPKMQAQRAVSPEGTQGIEGTRGIEGTFGREGTHGTEGTFGREGTHGIEGTLGREGTRGIEGTRSQQGTRVDGVLKMGTVPPPTVSAFNRTEKYVGVTVAKEDTDVVYMPKTQSIGDLNLFDGKNAIIKAVIYSEILGKRAQRR